MDCKKLLLNLIFFLQIHFSPALATEGAAPITAETLSSSPYLQNSVQLFTFGNVGTGFYLGDGKILTAAHTFTTNQFFPQKNSMGLALGNGQSVTLDPEDYKILLDPNSEMEVKWDSANGRPVKVVRDDIAIIQITNKKIIKALPSKPDIVIAPNFKLSENMELFGVGLWENKNVGIQSLMGKVQAVEGARFSLASHRIQTLRNDGKIVSEAIGNFRTLPGDSGGPLFIKDSRGQVLLVAIHHASFVDPTNFNFTRHALHQPVLIDSLTHYADVNDLKWRKLRKRPSLETLHSLSDLFYESIWYIMNPKSGQYIPTNDAVKRLSSSINAEFLWPFSDEELRLLSLNLLKKRNSINPASDLRKVFESHFLEQSRSMDKRAPVSARILSCKSLFQ